MLYQIPLQIVLPAQAGVILILILYSFLAPRTPRASGGDPEDVLLLIYEILYSPRKRG